MRGLRMQFDDIREDLIAWEEQVELLDVYRRYINGEHSKAWHSLKYKRYARQLMDMSPVNFCPHLVRKFTDGISISGWENSIPRGLRNDLKRIEQLVTFDAFAYGNSYVIANKFDKEVKAYHVSPMEMYCVVDDDDPSRLTRAIRVRHLDDIVRVQVIDDLEVHTFEYESTNSFAPDFSTSEFEYKGSVLHGFDVVPVCWFKHNPSTQFTMGQSVLKDAIRLQDQYNKLNSDMIYASEANVQRSRAITGMDMDDLLPSVDESGNPQPAKINHDMLRDSIIYTPGNSVHEFSTPNLDGCVAMKNSTKIDMFAVVGAPLYDLTGAPDNVSVETVQQYEARVRSARIAFQNENDSVWNGLMKLYGFDTYPIWVDLDSTVGVMPSENNESATLA